MANVYGTRTIKLTTTGIIPYANFKIKGGLWTGMTAGGQVFSITDATGTTYDITSYAENYPVTIPEWGWISGPANVIALPSGEVALYLTTK